jgi:hypothetical protein
MRIPPFARKEGWDVAAHLRKVNEVELERQAPPSGRKARQILTHNQPRPDALLLSQRNAGTQLSYLSF